MLPRSPCCLVGDINAFPFHSISTFGVHEHSGVMFLRKKHSQRGGHHPPPSSADVKERVALYLYSSSGSSWPVLGWTVPCVIQNPCYPPTRLHSVITQNATIWILIALNFKSHKATCILFKINKPDLWNTLFHEINYNVIHAILVINKLNAKIIIFIVARCIS